MTAIVRSAAALFTVGLLGCASPAPNVIVVLIDTFRADHLGALGDGASPTPFLDSLAEHSFVFHAAYAQSAWTSPSVASLFTSRYQSQHGITSFESVLAGGEQTLAELLEQHGYRTGGFSANSLVRAELGFAQGFDHFAVKRGVGPKFREAYERTSETGARALAWIDQLPSGPQPLFLYLQVMDPHTPYAPTHAALEETFADRDPPPLRELNAAVANRLAKPLDPGQREIVKRLYDAEVRSADAALAKLFGGLDARGVTANAVVVVLADHGEELWDHGAMGHSNGLFDEVIRTPLMIGLPGQTARYDVATPVAEIDVAPTLLELSGVPIPAGFEGRSLASHMRDRASAWRGLRHRVFAGTEDPPRPIVSELIQSEALRRRPHERAVTIGAYKLIIDVDGERHYFDRNADPGERGSTAIPATVRARLDRALDAFLERMPADAGAERIPMDATTREELKALGYIQ